MILWTKAVGAVVALAALLIGVPVLLIATVGNPWPPEGLVLTAPLTDNAIIGMLATATWVMWAQLVVCVIGETIEATRERHQDISLPGVLGLQRQLARALVGAIIVAVVSAPTSTTVVSARADAAPVASVPDKPTTTGSANGIPEKPEAGTPGLAMENPPGAESQPPTVTVQRGDTLWALAAKHLGEPERWDEIAVLNDGADMGDGHTFTTARNIRPGWVLTLPRDATNLDKPAAVEHHTVRPGDTLSQIALDTVGDADAYPELFDASRHVNQPGGRHLIDPDHIEPGWTIDIPTDHAADPTTAPPASTPRHVPPASATPGTANPHSEPDRSGHGLSPRAIDDHDEERAPDPTSNDRPKSEHATDEPADDVPPSWIMPGLAGAGTLLAGGLLLALRRLRASQHRTRRPGRTLPPLTPRAATVEKSVVVAGSPTASTVELVDDVLKRLAGSINAVDDVQPMLAAVEVTPTAVALHLKEAATPPPQTPWTVSDDLLLWVVDTDIDPKALGPAPADRPAPWPMLVTIGRDERDSTWLLNLEDLNITVTGDQTTTADFARFIAAEVACNPWSAETDLDLLGIATEVAPMSPDRIRVHDDPRGAAREAVAEAVHTIDRLAEHHADIATARSRQDDPDPWPSRLLIADRPDATDELDQLSDLIRDHGGHTATALMTLGDDDEDHAGEFRIHIDEHRRLTIPAVHLTVQAVGLTVEEAHGCASLLAQADQQIDAPAPDLDGAEPWQSMATAMGSLREQYRVGRTATTIEDFETLLGDDNDAYTAVAATTNHDLEALAPKVTGTVRDQVAANDPDLDADLADWFADTCPRPRLALLGPVQARTGGKALDKRKPYYTELLAYLTTRPHGATTDEVATAFDITPARVRVDINKLRSWLGSDPATGEKYLPDARHASGAQERGLGVYEVINTLVDADLFRRLRLRAETSGSDGMDDLVQALQLITGRPFEKLRRSGWGWLFEGDRLDQHIVCAITDVAHVVVTHSLHVGAVDQAYVAARIALTAAPDEEVARLDLAAVLDAQGHHVEAARILREDVCNRSDDGQAPTEVPDRTEQILDTRGWLRRTAG